MGVLEDTIAIYRAILEGKTKEQSPIPLTPKLNIAWDNLVEEVAEIVAAGGVPSIPFETPDISDLEIGERLKKGDIDPFTGLPWPGIEDEEDEETENVAKMSLVSKSVEENRFTLGPMYVPNRKDAHGEWTDDTELQKAVWDYMRKNDRRIRLQHNRDIVAGEALEVVTWPYEVTVPMLKADGTMGDVTFPPNTAFLGVQWEPWAWDMVKAGKLRGYSIGGRAQRLEVDLPQPDESVQKDEGGAPAGDAPVSGPTVNTVHEDVPLGSAKKKGKKGKEKAITTMTDPVEKEAAKSAPISSALSALNALSVPRATKLDMQAMDRLETARRFLLQAVAAKAADRKALIAQAERSVSSMIEALVEHPVRKDAAMKLVQQLQQMSR